MASPVISTEDWERREVLQSPDLEKEATIYSGRLGSWSTSRFVGDASYIITQPVNSPSNKLYVLWTDDRAQAEESGYSVSVREFNVAPEYILGEPRCIDEACTRFMIKATHAFEEISQHFVVILTNVGRYNVSLASERQKQLF